MTDGTADGTSPELTVESGAKLLESMDLDFLPEDADTPEDPAEPPKKRPAQAAAPSDETDETTDEDETPESPAEETPETEEESEESDADAESAEETAEEPAPVVTTHKVKVDGEELEVTTEELVAGYSRTANYTRKSQALADDRRKFETEELPMLRQKREQYASLVEQLTAVLKPAQEPDWNQLQKEMEPGEFSAAVAQWTLNQNRRQKAEEELARVRAEADADYAADLEKAVAQEKAKLQDALPEWKDPAIATKERAELRDYATMLGYGADDLNQVRDHRIILMLRKAMLYDRSVAAAKAAKSPAKPSAKAPAAPAKGAAPAKPAAAPLKPGAAKAPENKVQKQRNEGMRRLRATGSERDAATVIESMIED